LHLDRPGDLLKFLLTFYVKTTEGLDPVDSSPVFSLPRNREVDRLLCELSRGRLVTEELLRALSRHHNSPFNDGAEELTSGWARETANKIHQLPKLRDRLGAYIEAVEEHQAHVGFEEGTAADGLVFSIDAEPPEARLKTVEPEAEPASDEPEQPEPAEPSAEAAGPPVDHEADDTTITPLESFEERTPTPTWARSEDELTWDQERHYFQRRLSEELSRAGRDNAQLSVVVVQVRLLQESWETSDLVEESIRGSLREYDICCRTAMSEFHIILPGAGVDVRLMVVQRLRKRIAADLAGLSVHLGVGVATWPEDGSRAEDLLEEVNVALIEDRHRQMIGAGRRFAPVDDQVYLTTVSFEGFPQPVRVQAVQTPQGIRLRMPLKFLRRGSWVRLLSPAGSTDLVAGHAEATHSTGVLTEAVLGRGNHGPVPMLYVDVGPPPEE
jgi:GGDEF domain-containing protein